MSTGTIKTKVEAKNFGFIAVPGKEKDVFFHADALVDVTFESLKVGDAVEFDEQDDVKGPRAVNVRKV